MTNERPPEEQGLLNDIIANPDDDVPRLIYADWLEDRRDGTRGDGTRAEFIRVSCRAAALPKGPEKTRLKKESEQLLLGNAQKWVAPLVRRHCSFVYHVRGLPEHVVIPAARLLRHQDEIFAAAPIRSVELTGVEGQIQALAESPYLCRIAKIKIPFEYLNAEEVGQLTASPGIGALRHFALRFIGDEPAIVLAGAESLSGLISMDLYGNYIGDPGAEALARSDCLPALTRLSLGGNRISDEGVAAFLETTLPSLAELDLRGNMAISHAMRQQIDARFPWPKNTERRRR